MATQFPSDIDTFVRPEPDDVLSDPSHAELHDDAFDAIEAIEQALGVSPAGSAATVADRLTAIEQRLDALEGP